MASKTFKRSLMKRYDLDNNQIDLKAIFKKFPEIDPNDPKINSNNPLERVILHVLIEEEETDTIDFLLNHAAIKADPNTIDKKTSLTPLCSAIQDGYLEIAKLLVKAGADIDTPSEGMTPA